MSPVFSDGRDPLGERRAGEADARAQLEHVDRAEGLAEQPHLAAGRVHLRRGQLQQRRLPRPVGSQHHPPVVGLDGPVHAAQEVGLPPHHVDPGHPDDRLGGGCARHAPIQSTPRAALAHPRAPEMARSPRDADDRRARTTAREVLPGSPAPLGALWDGTGTNFALWSAGAQAVDLCLFDADGTEHRHRLEETTHQVWHGRLAGVGPGQRYGYRVHGIYDPLAGLRHNPAKLLLDPYTRAVDGDAVPAPVAVRLRRRRRGQRRPRRPGLRAVRAARRRRPRPVPVGRRPAAAHLVVGHRHLRGARQGRDGARTPASRRTCAAPTRAWRTRRSSSTCSRSASPRSSSCRCTTSSASRTCCAAA